MKTIIFTMGTRGDVQPYIFLAQALQERGVEASIGTHPCWHALVTEAGVGFVPIGPDVDMEYEAAVIRGKTKNPVFSMLKTMNFVFKIIENSTQDIYKACEGMNLVIVSHSHMGAAEAEALHIRTVDVTLQTETIPEPGKPAGLFGRVAGSMITAQMVKPYNKIRRNYQLPKLKSMDECMSPCLNLIPISRYVLKRSPYWTEKNQIVGYWYQKDADFTPDARLTDFLSAGDRPVILALGAMSFESGQEREKLDLFVHALQKTGRRAVIQGFHKTLEDYELPDTMLAIGSVPHSWLFPKGWCVIHHCGFGTAASSMIYGIPSLPVPHVLDQFGVAQNLYQLGVSCEPVKSGELTEQRLVDAIRDIETNYERLSEKVTELSEKMQQEKGLEKAVELILDGMKSL